VSRLDIQLNGMKKRTSIFWFSFWRRKFSPSGNKKHSSPSSSRGVLCPKISVWRNL